MCSVPIGMIVGRTHVLDYPVNLGLSYVTLIAAEAGRGTIQSYTGIGQRVVPVIINLRGD